MIDNVRSRLRNVDTRLLALIALQAAIFWLLIYPNNFTQNMIPYDVNRDLGYANHILAGGGIFDDPSLKDAFIWYPPINPLLAAGFSLALETEPSAFYKYSIVFINLLIPVAGYLLFSAMLSRNTAFLSATLFLVMPWLKSHIYVYSMPSMHGILFVLVGLYVFYKSAISNPKHIYTAAIICGIALLHHSLSGLILYSSISFYLLLDHWKFKSFTLKQVILYYTIPLLMWAPYITPNILQSKINYAPLHYLAPELSNKSYAWEVPNAYLCVIFLILIAWGGYALTRNCNRKSALLLTSLLLVTLGGQLLGYLQLLPTEWKTLQSLTENLPYIVPHEFQWFFQLFLCPIIALGFCEIQKRFSITWIPANYVIFLLLVAPSLYQFYSTYPKFKEEKTSAINALVWIKQNTDVYDTVLSSNTELSFKGVHAKTGRKILYMGSGHMNFNYDVASRKLAQNEIIYKANKDRAQKLISYFDVDYAIIKNRDLNRARKLFFDANFKEVYSDEAYKIYRFNPMINTASTSDPSITSISHEQLHQKRPNNSPWNHKANYIFPPNTQLRVDFLELQFSRSLYISADQNDSYVLRFQNGNETYSQTSHLHIAHGKGGLQERKITVPKNIASKGYDRIILEPLVGDGRFSIGHIIPI